MTVAADLAQTGPDVSEFTTAFLSTLPAAERHRWDITDVTDAAVALQRRPYRSGATLSAVVGPTSVALRRHGSGPNLGLGERPVVFRDVERAAHGISVMTSFHNGLVEP